MELVLARSDFDALETKLLTGSHEACAVLYVRQVVRTDGSVRLLVRDIETPTSSDYIRQGVVEAELTPAFVARVTKHARSLDCGLVFAHSHPGTHPPVFSDVDDLGEARLAAFLAHRHPGRAHAALVISAGGVRARQLGRGTPLRIIALGHNRDILYDPQTSSSSVRDVFDRQVRAFGASGQKALQDIRVAIVGLGGTGSLIVQQLAHLGVSDFLLVDPDTLEETNLNRVVGTMPSDVGMPKVEIAARLIRSVNPQSTVRAMQGDVIRAKTAIGLIDADIIFGCTDSHGSRSVLQQIAYQYLIPCIDMGTVIVVEQGHVKHISGRTQLLAPGLACFTCSGLLNASEVRRDMMTAFERQADPYIEGAREPAPAVISINSTVASVAVTMLLSMVTGVPSPARHVLYNAIKASLRSVHMHADPNCYICSKDGAMAQGDGWPLMARQD